MQNRLFSEWAEKPMQPEEMVKQFRDLFYLGSRRNCELPERETPPATEAVPFTPEEPARK